MEIFFSETNKLSDEDFFQIESPVYLANQIVLEGKFVGIPAEAHTWRGFKGRVILTKQLSLK